MTTLEINQNQLSDSSFQEIEALLDRNDPAEIRAFFEFDSETSEREVIFLFNLWGRKFFPKYYKVDDAPFHHDIDTYNCRIYRGLQRYFVDIAFRGAAKTTRTKLFVAFAIANDVDHKRKYIKVLSADRANAVQIVTDVYNMLINKTIFYFYPEIFQKTVEKRQETMHTFTTATGVKMAADTVGTDQRGDVQEDVRPDLIWFDDFETRKTLRSAVTTNAIWDNMDEAKQGLSIDGAALYNCNYLSERGNVHKLVESEGPETKVLITPIIGTIENGVHVDGPPTWPAAYTPGEAALKIKGASDPAGDYLCVPSAGADIIFDRKKVNQQEVKTPIRTIGTGDEFKIFHPYDPSHRYGSGHDVAGGVGLDSSTSVFIDFSTLPSRVVATYSSNTIKPTTFGDEIRSQADRFGEPIVAVENNKFDSCLERLRQLQYPNLYFQEMPGTRVGTQPAVRTLGWNTNPDTKPKMIYALLKAVVDGHLELSDKNLIAEVRAYTRDDLMDKPDDVRLTTRHFDLLIAAAIAYWMKDFATVKQETGGYEQGAYERTGLDNE
jgi:hypothetical protein